MKMKTLLEFHEAVKEIAAIKSETYSFVSAETDNQGFITYKSYINGFGYTTSKTVESNISQLKIKILEEWQEDLVIEEENETNVTISIVSPEKAKEIFESEDFVYLKEGEGPNELNA